MPDIFDVAVIGASIGGSTLACLLAEHNLKVALLDKRVFPRAKACGEGLSWRGVQALERMRLADVLNEQNSLLFNGYSVAINRNKVISIEDEHTGLGVNRQSFEMALLNKAYLSKQIVPLLGQNIEAVNIENGLLISKRLSLKAKFIIDASASGVKLPTDKNYSTPKRYGITFHVETKSHLPFDKVHIFRMPYGEFFCTPLGITKLNVSFLGYIRETNWRISNEFLRSAIRTKLERLGCLVHSFTNPVGISLTLGKRAPTLGENFLRVGDSCEQLDPIGGMGMTHALLCAEAAASTLKEIFNGNLGIQQSFEQYATAHEKFTRPLRAFTAMTQQMVCSWGSIPLASRIISCGIGRRVSQAINRVELESTWEQKALSLIGACI